MEQLDFLIDYLLKENIKLNIEKVPQTIEEKENLWRALCNIRDAKPISDEYLTIQDEFLQKRLESKEITDVYGLKTISNSNIICLWQGDITKLKIDCIVNAANSQGLGYFQPLHNCIDNQIQTYSGVQMRLECDKYMKTINYNLFNKKVVDICKIYCFFKIRKV
jgi:hypothetical protein